MEFRDEIVDQVIIDLRDMDVPQIGQKVVIEFEFVVVEHLLHQLATGDLSLLGGLEPLNKCRKRLFFDNLVIFAL